MKLITVIGTRPEIIRLSRVIPKLDAHFTHVLVHTGQNYDYELNKIFFDQLEIRKPDYFLNSADKSLAKTIGNIISSFDEVLDKESPDAMLVLGDTNSTLGIIPAKRKKIPIFHMEAGNRCFDQRVPEEINRKIVDHLADINLPYTQIARSYLIREGIKPDQIIVTGSPMLEVLNYYKDKIEASRIINDLQLTPGKYFVLSSHREENVDAEEIIREIFSALELISSKYSFPIIFSTHPRTRQKIEKYNLQIPNGVRLEKPFGFIDYIKLQKNALCTISDSGTITEEASILKLCAVNLRNAHERPEGFEKMVCIMSGLGSKEILDSIDLAIKLHKERASQPDYLRVQDYTESDVSSKIIGIIQSYTHYVNRFVWHKFI
jgi:UDP-N-acetylglucosamine 2-epimerase (non-hydrolysing)